VAFSEEVAGGLCYLLIYRIRLYSCTCTLIESLSCIVLYGVHVQSPFDLGRTRGLRRGCGWLHAHKSQFLLSLHRTDVGSQIGRGFSSARGDHGHDDRNNAFQKSASRSAFQKKRKSQRLPKSASRKLGG
jgi:hypothetical protein